MMREKKQSTTALRPLHLRNKYIEHAKSPAYNRAFYFISQIEKFFIQRV